METCIYCDKVELCNCFIANERVSLKIYGEDEIDRQTHQENRR